MPPTVQTLGVITPEEVEALYQINNRKMALLDLVGTLAQQDLSKSDLYTRLVSDMTSTRADMQRWWDDVCQKHEWQVPVGSQWHVDFRSREVSLSIPERK